jgi:hypothetical protein
MTRLIVVLAALALAGGLAACSLHPPVAPPLTAREWALCQQYWGSGLDPSQRREPEASTWYFNHMGFRNNPDTIRVCRAATANR